MPRCHRISTGRGNEIPGGGGGGRHRGLGVEVGVGWGGGEV